MEDREVPAYDGPELFVHWQCADPRLMYQYGMPGSDTSFQHPVSYHILGHIRQWEKAEIGYHLPPPYRPVLVYSTYTRRKVVGVIINEIGDLGSIDLYPFSKRVPPAYDSLDLFSAPPEPDPNNAPFAIAAAWLHYNRFQTSYGQGSTVYMERWLTRYRGFRFEYMYKYFEEQLGRRPRHIEEWWTQKTVRHLQVVSET